MNELMLGIILMFGIVGIILAKGSQEHIDYMNEKYREEKKNDTINR